MFKISLSDVSLLKDSIPIIAEILDEGIFNIDSNGISLLAPDRTMVSIVDFKLLSAAFDEFKIDNNESLGLNLGSLATVLKRIKNADKIVLESGKSKLKIKVYGNGVRTFQIPLLDVKIEKPPVQQLNFPGKIELESSILDEGISDADIASDAIIFTGKPEQFKMSASGDISSAELEIKKGDQGLLNLNINEEIKSQYSLEYLKKMVKASKLAKQAVLEFGNDYPMRITYKVIDKMMLSFILAPRVSE